MPENSYEVALGNLSACLWIVKGDGKYWVSVPQHDLKVVVEHAKNQLKENK